MSTRPSANAVSLLRATIKQRLENVLGRTLSRDFYAGVCDELGIDEIDSLTDIMRFTNALIGHGGLLSSVGTAVKMKALMCGAQEPAEPDAET